MKIGITGTTAGIGNAVCQLPYEFVEFNCFNISLSVIIIQLISSIYKLLTSSFNKNKLEKCSISKILFSNNFNLIMDNKIDFKYPQLIHCFFELILFNKECNNQ